MQTRATARDPVDKDGYADRIAGNDRGAGGAVRSEFKINCRSDSGTAMNLRSHRPALRFILWRSVRFDPANCTSKGRAGTGKLNHKNSCTRFPARFTVQNVEVFQPCNRSL